MNLLHVYLPKFTTAFHGLSHRNFQRRRWLESAECERVCVTCLALYSGLTILPGNAAFGQSFVLRLVVMKGVGR